MQRDAPQLFYQGIGVCEDGALCGRMSVDPVGNPFGKGPSTPAVTGYNGTPLHRVLVKLGHDVELRQLTESLRLSCEPFMLIGRYFALQSGDEAQHLLLDAGQRHVVHSPIRASITKLPLALSNVPLFRDEGQAKVLVGGLHDDVGVVAEVVQGFALLTGAVEALRVSGGWLACVARSHLAAQAELQRMLMLGGAAMLGWVCGISDRMVCRCPHG